MVLMCGTLIYKDIYIWNRSVNYISAYPKKKGRKGSTCCRNPDANHLTGNAIISGGELEHWNVWKGRMERSPRSAVFMDLDNLKINDTLGLLYQELLLQEVAVIKKTLSDRT